MRILICSPSLLPQIGGRELVVHHLATEYTARGHDVLVAGAAGWRRFRHFSYGYPVLRWPGLPGLSRENSELCLMAATQLCGRFDVIHVHSTWPNGYTAARLARLFSAPVIVTPHGEDINVVQELGFGARLDPVKRVKIERALRNASRVTAISQTVFASLRDAGVEAERIVCIPNGVDLQRFQRPQSFDVLAHLGLPPDTFLVVSIGNHHPRKGHANLIESVRMARANDRRIRLVIVGRTSPDLCAQVAALGLSDHIRFAGILPVPMPGAAPGPDILAALLQAADVYVSASIDEGAEGLSLALLEGMAAGACPVVTKISGNRDLIDSERNGLLVEPGRVDQMADAFVRLANDRKLLGVLKQRATAGVRDFGWAAVAARYLALYEESVVVPRLSSGTGTL